MARERKQFLMTHLQIIAIGDRDSQTWNHKRVDRDNAQCVIDSHTNLTNKAMHAATLAGLARVTPSGKTKRRVYWWTSDCTVARNRTRLFFHIWKELGRPGHGQAYQCYRAARKAYKTTCRSAVNSVVHTNHRKLSRILACKRTGQFWNEVNRAKTAANERQECKTSLDTQRNTLGTSLMPKKNRTLNLSPSMNRL